MSRHELPLADSDTYELSELEESPFPDSKGPKSDAARLRSARKRVAQGGLEEAEKHPNLNPQRLLPARPGKRLRRSFVGNPDPIYQRIDAARCLLEDNGLTVAKIVEIMCAYDYGDQRTKSDPGFQLTISEAEDAQAVRTWAREIARQEILREGKQMEQHHYLNTSESFVKDGEHSSEAKQDEIPITLSVVGSIMWLKQSQRANLFAKGFTTYLYSSGVHAATINVLNRLGLGVSYSTLLESLSTLNRSCTERFRSVVARCESLFVWDNDNFEDQPAEQRIKNAGSFESGTASTVVELHPPPGCGPEIIDEALDLDKYLESVENAPDLELSDIIPTLEDEQNLRNEFVYETINIVVEHAGEVFKRFKKPNETLRPLIQPLLPLRVSKAYPLPTLHIEQASANGNATVIEELRRITQIDKSELFKRRLCLATGDLLTISRLLSVRDVRTLYMRTPVHIKDKVDNLSYLVPLTSLFHIRITAVNRILHTHFGKPNARPKDGPASLWRHNEILKRKNIPVGQAFKYRTVQDLTFHSLYARLLDIVRIESGSESLQCFGLRLAKLSDDEAWEQLKSVVSTAITRFTTPEEAGTDDVLRNSILFIRDALLFRCFVTSVKCGNMAMIELILKVWATLFRGSGRSQYVSELLRLRHNLVHAWPKPLRDLILSNMLVNMTGNKNGWKEIHSSRAYELLDKARGPNATWKWLAEISPCISTLRELAAQVNTSLAARNSNHHTTPNLQADLEALTKSLVESKVHEHDPTRHLDKTLKAKDALSLGLQSLCAHNSPIKEFNRDRFGARSNTAYATQ
ncbi:hypothetical protein RhiJN_12934 [Ceratobasidium sp. AG-Ba]|nr:hypothetical protein RhiJN_12934 [Ceratobasidium sp. AG-Ba]